METKKRVYTRFTLEKANETQKEIERLTEEIRALRKRRAELVKRLRNFKQHTEKGRKEYKETLSIKGFGKRLVDLTAEEKRQYYTQRQRECRQRKKEIKK